MEDKRRVQKVQAITDNKAPPRNLPLLSAPTVPLPQNPPQRAVAGVFPRSAERSGLFLAAEPAPPPGAADVGPAAELQQQQAEDAEEPPAGAAAGAPQGRRQVSLSGWSASAGGAPQRVERLCLRLQTLSDFPQFLFFILDF